MRSPAGITVSLTNTARASTEKVLSFMSTTSFHLVCLVNELDGVFKPAQRFWREGAEGVDGYKLERT